MNAIKPSQALNRSKEKYQDGFIERCIIAVDFHPTYAKKKQSFSALNQKIKDLGLYRRLFLAKQVNIHLWVL